MNTLLSKAHQTMLQEASGLSEATIQARGYRTVSSKSELMALGFKEYQARVPGLLIPIFGATGEIVSYQFRPDSPRITKVGKSIKYESLGDASSRLDIPPAICGQIANPSVPLWMTEGVKKADATAQQGLCCLALPGVWNFKGKNEQGGSVVLGDFEQIALKGRIVYIAFDSDAAQNRSVLLAEQRLAGFLKSRGAEPKIVRLPSNNGEKVGLDDYFVLGGQMDGLLERVQEQSTDSESDKKSKSTQIVELAEEQGLLLVSTPSGVAYGRVPLEGGYANYKLASKEFRQWLAKVVYQEMNSALGDHVANEAIGLLAAKACFGENPKQEAHLRVAGDETCLFIDLGTDAWEVVEVTADGWRIVTDPQVLFRRSAIFGALPHPVKGGDIQDLRQFVNAKTDEDFLLMVAWLLMAFHPSGPYPILVLSGEQGSAKSTTAKVLKSLCDPTTLGLRQAPREDKDLKTAALNSHVLAFDNLSKIPEPLSDSLCRLSTGGGISNRANYTDDEEAFFEGKRPVILTAVEDVVEKPDLADRALFPQLPVLLNGIRSESEFWREFHSASGRIMGALFDALVTTLRNLPLVTGYSQFRMADFARFILSAEPALDLPVRFETAYSNNRQEVRRQTASAHPLAMGLIQLLASQASWEGTATELVDALRAHLSEPEQKALPTSRAMKSKLKIVLPLLRQEGIEFSERRESAKRLLLFEKPAENVVISSFASSADSKMQIADDNNDTLMTITEVF